MANKQPINFEEASTALFAALKTRPQHTPNYTSEMKAPSFSNVRFFANTNKVDPLKDIKQQLEKINQAAEKQEADAFLASSGINNNRSNHKTSQVNTHSNFFSVKPTAPKPAPSRSNVVSFKA